MTAMKDLKDELASLSERARQAGDSFDGAAMSSRYAALLARAIAGQRLPVA